MRPLPSTIDTRHPRPALLLAGLSLFDISFTPCLLWHSSWPGLTVVEAKEGGRTSARRRLITEVGTWSKR